jgi:hypothetical protein
MIISVKKRMNSELNIENPAEDQARSHVSEPSRVERELGLGWVESEVPVRLFADTETRSEKLEATAHPMRAKGEKVQSGKVRQEIYQVLRNDSAPTIEEKIEYRKLDPSSEEWFWGKGVGNWLPDYKLGGFAIFQDEQSANDYVEKERELYRRQLEVLRKSA